MFLAAMAVTRSNGQGERTQQGVSDNSAESIYLSAWKSFVCRFSVVES